MTGARNYRHNFGYLAWPLPRSAIAGEKPPCARADYKLSALFYPRFVREIFARGRRNERPNQIPTVENDFRDIAKTFISLRIFLP